MSESPNERTTFDQSDPSEVELHRTVANPEVVKNEAEGHHMRSNPADPAAVKNEAEGHRSYMEASEPAEAEAHAVRNSPENPGGLRA